MEGLEAVIRGEGLKYLSCVMVRGSVSLQKGIWCYNYIVSSYKYLSCVMEGP